MRDRVPTRTITLLQNTSGAVAVWKVSRTNTITSNGLGVPGPSERV